MNQDVIIWRAGSKLIAGIGSAWDGLYLRGRRLEHESGLGDYDILRLGGNIVGFSFSVTKQDVDSAGPLIDGAGNAILSPGRNQLRVLFGCDERTLVEVDGVQASSAIYSIDGKPACLVLHQWAPWKDFGFKLVPVPFATPKS